MNFFNIINKIKRLKMACSSFYRTMFFFLSNFVNFSFVTWLSKDLFFFLSGFINFSSMTWFIKELCLTILIGKHIIKPQYCGLWIYFISLSVFYGVGILINELYPSDPMPVGPYESSIKNEDEVNCTQEAINYYYNTRVDELYRDGAHRWNAMKQMCVNEANPETKQAMIKVLTPANEDIRLHLEDKIYVIEVVNAVEKKIIIIQNSKNT